MPFSVDQAAGVMVIGEGGYFEGLRREASDAPYTVRRCVAGDPRPRAGPPPPACAARAPTIRPRSWPCTVPTPWPTTRSGEASLALLAEIRTEAGARANALRPRRDDPRHPARPDTVQIRHRRPRPSTVRDISVVECFARIKRGYCEYYASTMAVLLREMGVPTRYVEGYAAGRWGARVGTLGRSQPRCPRLGPGVLPRLRLGRLRPDRRRRGRGSPPLPSGRPDASASAGPSRTPGFVRPAGDPAPRPAGRAAASPAGPGRRGRPGR